MSSRLPMKTTDRLVVVLLAGIALLGVGVLLVCTSWGIGLSDDSVNYIRAARQLLGERGVLEVVIGKGEGKRLSHYTPMYPTVLAIGGMVRIEPLVGARWLNAWLFGSNILLVGWILYRVTSGSVWTAVVGSVLMLTSVEMLSVHSMAMSEPLFILFGFLGLYCVAAYLETPKPGLLLVAATAFGVAFLTRYAGAPFVATGVAGIWLMEGKPSYRRMVDSSILLAISGVPMALWIARNWYLVGSLANRKMVYHPITGSTMHEALQGVSSWIFPERVARNGNLTGLLVVIILGLLIVGVVVQWKERLRRADRAVMQPSRGPFPILLALFVPIYTGFLVVSLSYFDAGFSHRYLSPIFIAGLILILCQAHRFLSVRKGRRSLHIAVVSLCVAFTAWSLVWGTVLILEYHREGRGYARKELKQSDIINMVRALPPGTTIYSNRPFAIYALFGKLPSSFPRKVFSGTLLANPHYQSQMAAIGEDLKRQDTVVVYLHPAKHNAPSEGELQEIFPLRLLHRGDVGSLYGIR